MSGLSALAVAWAAVHAYVACYSGAVYAKRRSGREHLWMSVLAAGCAVFSVGVAFAIEARDEAGMATAMRVQLAGGPLILAGFVAFAAELVGMRTRRPVSIAFGTAVVMMAANFMGLLFDPARPAPLPEARHALAPKMYDLAPPPLLIGLSVLAFATCVWAALAVARGARTDRDLRIIAAGWVPVVIALVNDLVVTLSRTRSPYLFEHALLISTSVGSFVLLRRLVREGDELAQRTAELHRSVEELRELQAELVRKGQLAAVGELSAVIAHEVRNPLTVLQNAASGLRRPQIEEPDRTTLLGILDEETDRLNRLVRDLLTYARPLAPQREAIPIEDFLRDAIERALRVSPKARDVEIDVDLDDAPPAMHGDPDLLRGALVHVVENALQAMPYGGTLGVRARGALLDETTAVELSIHDTGEGMDTLVRSKARDPFFTTRPTGTGLGLAIVERVVAAHGGEVHLESSYGTGTTVRIVLPDSEMLTPRTRGSTTPSRRPTA